MPGKNKMYIFAGGHMVAAGEGNIVGYSSEMVTPSEEMVNIELGEKWEQPTHEKEEKQGFSASCSCRIEKDSIGKHKWWRVRRQLIGKKARLPRKLKKAARHADFRVFDLQTKNAAHPTSHMVSFTIEYDLRVCITPAGYPRTRSIIRLAKLFRRELNKNYQKFIQNKFKKDRTI